MAFAFSKIFWAFFAPGNILFILGFLGARMALGQHRGRQRAGARLCLIVASIGLAFIFLPIGDWLLLPLEGSGPAPGLPAQIDGIILLGGAEDTRSSIDRHQPAMRYAADRYLVFSEMAQRYPQARLIFAGGTGELSPAETGREKDIAQSVTIALGIPQSRMTYEGASRNTRENATFAADIVHPKPDQHWLLVTSAFHMTRALAVFRKAGWNVSPAPADYQSSGEYFAPTNFRLYDQLYKATNAVHEYFGLVAYRLMGYTDSLWPKW